jgi:spore coat-associated protein N
MSMKKKLTMGAMSAALGLSLVAGGTWAAFNDIEEVNASFAAGTLNLTLADLAGDANNKTFSVSNLKPGDKMTRTIVLKNDGSLAMKDVLLSIDGINFTDYTPATGDTDTFGSNSALEYLSQFKVKVVNVGAQGGGGYPIDIILQDITLAELYLATSLTPPAMATPLQIANAKAKLGNTTFVKDGYFDDSRVQVTPRPQDYSPESLGAQYAGIPVGVEHRVAIEIEFAEYSIRDGRGVEEQNKYQGDKVDVTFSLEGRQWDGQEVTASDVDASGSVTTNGLVNNGDPLTQQAGLTNSPAIYIWDQNDTEQYGPYPPGSIKQYNINFNTGVKLGDFSSAEVHFYAGNGDFLGKNSVKPAALVQYASSTGLTGLITAGIHAGDTTSDPFWNYSAYNSETELPAKAVFKFVKNGVEYSYSSN